MHGHEFTLPCPGFPLPCLGPGPGREGGFPSYLSVSAFSAVDKND